MKQYYPTPQEVDEWIGEIWREALSTPFTAEIIDDPSLGNRDWFFVGQALYSSRFVKITPQNGDPFYVYWQPVENGPAPLCVHLPGYGCEMTHHPDIVAQGFNVLEVSPLGLCTPHGKNAEKIAGYSVFPDTITSLARGGYFNWLTHCILAVLWAWSQPQTIPERVSFFGTSQGGGTALLCGSLFRDRNARCVAADEPFLAGFEEAVKFGAFGDLLPEPLKQVIEKHGEAVAYKTLGYVESICHAHRLTMPVLLTSGSADELIPAECIKALFEMLPKTRCYLDIEGRGHGFTPEFAHLVKAWFRLYA